MKIAVLLATGFEEGEALFIVDVLRRAGFDGQCVSTTNDKMVTGAHGIRVEADCLLTKGMEEYDMIILPGGLPGATNLRDNEDVIALVQYFNIQNKYIGAICAAPIVLERAGVVTGRKITSYPGNNYISLFKEANYVEDIVAIDDHLITSRGPATTLPFVYAIVDMLGGNSQVLKKGMLYDMVYR